MDTTQESLLEQTTPETITGIMHEALRFVLMTTHGSNDVWQTVKSYLSDSANLFCDESPMSRFENGFLFRDGSSIRLIKAERVNGVTDIMFSVTRGLAFGFLPETDERILHGKIIGFTYRCKQDAEILVVEKTPITIRGE